MSMPRPGTQDTSEAYEHAVLAGPGENTQKVQETPLALRSFCGTFESYMGSS